MHDHRRRLGRVGERVAEEFLTRRGATSIDRNVRVDRGEVDLIVSFRGERTVVEVRTVQDDREPSELFPPKKRAQVRRLARRLGCPRVDLVAVRVGAEDLVIRWFPDVR